jgi:hypothetical protein
VRFVRSVAVVFLLALSSAALDREAFSFQKYDLQISLEPATHAFVAHGRVTARNDSPEPQRSVVLQISSSLRWGAVRVGGRPAQVLTQLYTSDLDHTGALAEAIVTLAQAVAPGGAVDLDIEYSGAVEADATRLTRMGVPAAEGARSDWDRVSGDFTAVRGAGYVAWYPVAMPAGSLSEGDAVFAELARWREREARASMHVNLCAVGVSGTVPTIIMNARQSGVGGGLVGGGPSQVRKCAEFALEPMGRVTPVFAIGSFHEVERPVIQVNYLGHNQGAAQEYALAAEKVEPLTSEWFGEPREKVRVIELADPHAVPFESGAMLFTPLDTSDSKRVQLEMAHQLTHATFPSARDWIYEGLAHFAQALARERRDGRRSALDYMSARLAPLVAAEKAASRVDGAAAPAGQPLVSASDEIFYRTKAMYVWWMLRDLVGDAALQQALRSYRPADDKEFSYLQRLIAARYRPDLEWFFDDWVYRDRGLPDFSVSAANPRASLAGGYVVAITISNSGSARAEVPVQVQVRGEAGELSRRLRVAARGESVTRIPVPGVPLEASVNDGSVPERDLTNNSMQIPAAAQH